MDSEEKALSMGSFGNFSPIRHLGFPDYHVALIVREG